MDNDGVLAPFTQQEYEEKATEYIRAMREVRPNGPYFLTGFCEGAHIAFEMARQLKALNLEVGVLFILDVFPVENTVHRGRFMLRNYGRLLRQFLKSNNRARIAMVSHKLHGLPAVTPQQPIVDGKLVRNYDSRPEARKRLSKLTADRYWPGKDFKPTIYDGDIVVFRLPKQPFHYIRDKDLGWGRRVRGKVEIVQVPGTHGLILRNPGVSVVGREIEARINAYLAHRKHSARIDE
jgi:thioesterase domain-containing protein